MPGERGAGTGSSFLDSEAPPPPCRVRGPRGRRPGPRWVGHSRGL